MSQSMIVQCASFKGNQVIRKPIERPVRKGKTAKDHKGRAKRGAQ